ncbi:hypothetical protein EMIT019CA3_30079 [Bacillus pseudomycoides]
MASTLSAMHVIPLEGLARLLGGRSFYPALTGSKTHTSKFGKSKEVRWGMKKTPTD